MNIPPEEVKEIKNLGLCFDLLFAFNKHNKMINKAYMMLDIIKKFSSYVKKLLCNTV